MRLLKINYPILSFFNRVFFSLIVVFSVASCGDIDPEGENMKDACDEVSTLEGSVTMDGEEQKLIVASVCSFLSRRLF